VATEILAIQLPLSIGSVYWSYAFRLPET